MKKKLFLLTLLIALIQRSYSQSTQAGVGPPGHSPGAGGVPTQYLGWDAGPASNTIPLSIEHRGTNNIDFFTGGVQRMTILGTSALNANAGNVGIGMTNPDMPLCVRGGTNDVTSAGWRRGIHLFNRAVLAWAQTAGSQALFMGHPNFGADQSFYCGLAANTTSTAVPNYVYRIIGNPVPNLTSPTSGDVEFYHSTNVYANIGVGLNAGVTPNILTPTNRIEINTTATTGGVAPTVILPNGNSGFGVLNAGGGTGFSGLRFTDLRSTSVTYSSNPGKGVLSVDANGDVIYVPDAPGNTTPITADNGLRMNPTTTNVQWGQLVGSLPQNSQLTFNTEIPLNNQFLVFTKPSGVQAFNQNNIGIGTNNPSARLDIVKDLSITDPLNNMPIALRVENTDVHKGNPNTGSIYGVYSVANALNRGNYGGFFKGTSPSLAEANIGVFGEATQGKSNIAVGGFANSSDPGTLESIGGNFISIASSGVNYGVYARVPTNSGGTGPGSPLGTDIAGYFDGDVLITNMYGPSDKNLKKDIKRIANATDLINKLNPVTYLFDTDNNKNINLPGRQQYGFISQEVEKILPELTAVIRHPAQLDEFGKEIMPSKEYLGLNYQNFIAILAKGLQEQHNAIEAQNHSSSDVVKQLEEQKKINEELKNKLDKLEQLITSCCTNNSAESKQAGNITLSDKNVVVLNQNAPNPFAEQTSVSYNVPVEFKSAQIVFYTEIGNSLYTYDIKEKGYGQLNVFANDLSNGMYHYALIIDGKVIETKKMVKSQ